MAVSTQELSKYLQEHHIRPSYPRLKVLEYLMIFKSHPTVDEIYTALAEEIPTLSKTTVYNTLNLFIQEGIARLVSIEDHETRYDADTTDHGHFKCELCQRIYDFPIDFNALQDRGLQEFRIREKNVYYKGTCSSCLDNNNTSFSGGNL